MSLSREQHTAAVAMHQNDVVSASTDLSFNPVVMPSPMSPLSPNEGALKLQDSQQDIAARRHAQIKKLDDQQSLSPANLRQLFRLMDIDNSQSLSFSELKSGLAAMKIFADFTSSASVVNQLLEEVDTDRSGVITEKEFVDFFQRLQRHDLAKKLKAYQNKGTSDIHISAIVFTGKGGLGIVDDRREGLALKDLPEFLANCVQSEKAAVLDYHVWLDVVGFDETMITLLSNVLGLHVESLSDPFIIQRQKVDIFAAQHSAPISSASPRPAEQHRLTATASSFLAEEDVAAVEAGAEKALAKRAASEAGMPAEPLEEDFRVQFLLHAMSMANPPFRGKSITGRAASKIQKLCGCCSSEYSDSADTIKGRDAAIAAAQKLAKLFEGDAVDMAGQEEEEVDDDPRPCGCTPRPVSASAKPVLAAASRLRTHPPDIALEQFSMFIVNDRTLLTVRSPSVSAGGKSYKADKSKRAPAAGDAKKWTRDHSVIGILFRGLRRRIRQAGAANYLYTSSVRALACDILDAVTQFNFGIRDALTDWHLALEDSIQHTVSSLHTPHLYALAKVSDTYARQMEPLNKVFAAVAHDYAKLHDVDTMPATAAPLSLVAAFSDQLPMLMELKDDISAVSSDVQGVRDSISNLKNLLASLQDEYMNRTLFILTLVTAFCTPFAVMTGYYGMNFDFVEIDGGNGVGAFWIPMAVMVFLMLVAFWRGGFFRMLM